MAKVNMFFFFGIFVFLSTLLHNATARGRTLLFSSLFTMREFVINSKSATAGHGQFELQSQLKMKKKIEKKRTVINRF